MLVTSWVPGKEHPRPGGSHIPGGRKGFPPGDATEGQPATWRKWGNQKELSAFRRHLQNVGKVMVLLTWAPGPCRLEEPSEGKGLEASLGGMDRTKDVLACTRGGWGPHIPVLSCGKERVITPREDLSSVGELLCEVRASSHWGHEQRGVAGEGQERDGIERGSGRNPRSGPQEAH